MNTICMRHGVKVVSDEIHCELIMPGQRFQPFAAVSEACRENSVILNSPSKSFNIAGLQIANIICSQPEWRRRINRAIKTMHIDAIIFQDYDKGCITQRIIDEVTTLARRKKILTTVDPKHRNFSSFKNVTLFKPNLKELREGLNIEIDDSSEENLMRDLMEASKILHERQNIDIVLTTLSSRGMYACDYRSGEAHAILVPSCAHSVSDVSGAGDTVISVITLALAAGMELDEAVRCANLAGGIVCEQVGVVPINPERLKQEMGKAH